jgi:hypothetical protein
VLLHDVETGNLRTAQADQIIVDMVGIDFDRIDLPDAFSGRIFDILLGLGRRR